MEISRHLDEEEIEKYSVGDTAKSDLARVEEHLLLCRSCQQRVESADIIVHSMQQATARCRMEPERAPRWLGMPRFVLPLAAAFLVLAAILIPRDFIGGSHPPFAIGLAATRGAGIEAKAPEDTPLALQLDVTGLPAAASYKLEMVDGTGIQVWTGTFPGANVKPTPAGTYFVRLYSPAGDLLREYGLEIEPRR